MSDRSDMFAASMASRISPQHDTVRHATRADVPAITALINLAYRVERFFIDGERTTEAQVHQMRRDGLFLVLDATGLEAAKAGATGVLAGSVYVQIREDRGYFGLLAVASELQGNGVGRRLVGVAEALCQAEGCCAMDLKVVNLRTELPLWYRSMGYEEAGTAAFPNSVAPKLPCHFIRMTKELPL